MSTPIATPDTVAAAIKATPAGGALKLEGEFKAGIPLKDRKPNLTLDLTKAVISGDTRTGELDGLRLLGGRFTSAAPITLTGGGRNLEIEGAVFEGPAEKTGAAISLQSFLGVRLRDLKAVNYRNGLVLQLVDDAEVADVSLSGMQRDIIQMAGVRWVTIRTLAGHGSTPAAADHPDGIQIRNRPDVGRVCSDILIEDVDLMGPIQGIVTTHKAGDGGFDRITVRRARICAGHPNGAGFLAVRRLELEDVWVTTLPGSPYRSLVNVTKDCAGVVLKGDVGFSPYRKSEGGVLCRRAADPQLAADLAEAKASIATLVDINQRLAVQRDQHRASAIEATARLARVAELATQRLDFPPP